MVSLVTLRIGFSRGPGLRLLPYFSSELDTSHLLHESDMQAASPVKNIFY